MDDQHRSSKGHSPATVVWIDSREAIVARWNGSSVRLTRVESDVPEHRRSTGHVEHDPGRSPGGGGGSKATGEPHRLQHMELYLKEIAGRLPADRRLELIGPGTVHERLARMVAADDARRSRSRELRTVSAHALTDDQLRARVRDLAGVPLRRRRQAC